MGQTKLSYFEHFNVHTLKKWAISPILVDYFNWKLESLKEGRK